MPKEDLKLEKSSEKNNKPQNKVNIEVDNVKDNVLGIVENEEKTKILRKYGVLNSRRKSEYSFLTEIDNLPLFIEVMSVLPSRGGLIEQKFLKEYSFIGERKGLIEKIKEIGVGVINQNFKAEDLLFFLEKIDLDRLKKYGNDITYFDNKKYFAFKISQSSDFRDLLTVNLDKYIKLKEAIPGFNYSKIRKLNYDRDDLFYSIMNLDNIDSFIRLIKELGHSDINIEFDYGEIEENMFVIELEEYEKFFTLYGENGVYNLFYLNSILREELIIKSPIDLEKNIRGIEDFFKIDTESLKRVSKIIGTDKLSVYEDDIFFIQIKDIVKSLNLKTNSEKVDLLEYFHNHFGERFFYDADINYSINNSNLKLSDIRLFINKHNIQGEGGIKFLNFMFSGLTRITIEQYNIIKNELGDIFSVENIINNFLDDERILLSLKKIFIYPADNYIYLFKKYKQEFLSNKEEFLINIKDHFLPSGNSGLGLRNIQNIEEIFGIDISYDDFKNIKGVFIIGTDLKDSFTFLDKQFPGQINSLEKLSEFNVFYTNFEEIKEYHKFFIEKLNFTENDFKNKEKISNLKECSAHTLEEFSKLEDFFGIKTLLKYLGKKDDIIKALMNDDTLIFLGKSISPIMEYIGGINYDNKYEKIGNLFFKFKAHFMGGIEDIHVSKLLKLIKNKGLNISPTFALHYVFTKNIEEEEELFIRFDNTTENLIKLKTINYGNDGLEEEIVNSVYNGVSSYTPKNLDEYKDQTNHLDKFIFDRSGYKMIFSGLKGYKLKEGEKVDNDLMLSYKDRIDNIRYFTYNIDYITSFIYGEFTKRNLETKTSTAESRIIEYLKLLEDEKGKLDIDDMNIVLAYQLLGKYQEFINGSNDKISKVEDEYSKNAFQLEALINEYGDNLKETINLIEKSIIDYDDKRDLEILGTKVDSIKETSNYKNLTKDRLLDQIIKGFVNIPDNKLNIEIIKKSLNTRFSTILQGNNYLKSRVNNLVNLFILEDFKNLELESNKIRLKEILELNVIKFLTDNNKINLDLSMIQKLQGEIYIELKKENDKYEEVKEVEKKSNGKLVEKSSKDRNIIGYFAKTKEQAKARGVGGICIGADFSMWINENYFEFVLMDIDRKINIGTVMLLNIEDNNNKYLLFGPNPSEEFTTKVSAKDLYYQILNIVSDFAKNNGYDGIILDTRYGRSTNRGGAFQTVLENSVLKDKDNVEIKIDLQKSHELGGGYEYKKGLNFVWKR